MRKIHYAWWIVVACCAINCCNSIIISNGSNFFNPVAQSLNIGIGQITIYITIMSLTMAALFPVMGKLVEKHLKKILFLGGLLQFGTFALMSTFQHVQQFWVAGLFLGVGGSITYAMAVPVLINMWFYKSQGLALGIAFSFQGIAAAFFSIVTGNVIAALGWRNAYLVLAICGALIYIPAVFFLVKTPQEKGLHPYGVEEVYKKYDSAQEKENGVTLQQALRHPSFYLMITCSLLMAMLNSESTQITAFSLGHFHLNIQMAATMLAIYNIGFMVGNLVLGIINDMVGFVSFVIAITLAVVAQFFLYQGTAIAVTVFFIGFAFSSYNLLLPLITRYIFGNKEYSRIWAYFMSAGSISGAFIVPIYGSIFDMTGSYSLVFIIEAIVGVLVGICGVTALMIRPGKRVKNL